MSESESSFRLRKLPLAALMAIVVVAAAEFWTRIRVNGWKLKVPAHKRVYREIVMGAREHYKDETLLVLGNSRSSCIIPFLLSLTLFDDMINEVYSLSAGGAMPATQERMLDALDYECIKKEHTVLFCLTPMGFNKNNTCFKRTIVNLFGIREFFTELVGHLRIEDALFYIGDCSLYLLRYGKEIGRDIKSALFERNTGDDIDRMAKGADERPLPKADKHVVNRKWVERTLEKFATEYYADYALDPYQIGSVRDVLAEVHALGAHGVLVMLPLPPVLRDLLGEGNLRLFIDKVRELAREENVPLLDYLSDCSGEEYTYFDGSHLTLDSRCVFTRRLGEDLKTIHDEYGFPRLDLPAGRDNRALTAEPLVYSSSRSDRITFRLSAGKSYHGRSYTLLGSMSGMTPGEYFGNMPFPLSLNWDFFTTLLIDLYQDKAISDKFMSRFTGVLGPEGKAEAILVLPDSIAGELVGRSMWFAFLIRNPIHYASNAVRIDFVE